MELQTHILVVEDEQAIRTALVDFLEYQGFRVTPASDGLQEKDRIQGLDLGADDYITKPFSLEEMLARIRAVLRRTDPARGVGQTFTFGDLQVDMSALKAQRGSRTVALSKLGGGG